MEMVLRRLSASRFGTLPPRCALPRSISGSIKARLQYPLISRYPMPLCVPVICTGPSQYGTRVPIQLSG